MNHLYIKKGITSILSLIFIVLLLLSILAFQREGDVNLFLKVKIPSLEVTEDTNYYPSAFNSVQEMQAASKAHDINVLEEGSVLLQNKNNTLPLSSTERDITLFGRSSVDPVYKGAAGSSSNSNPTSLIKALQDEAFNLNQTVLDALNNATDANSAAYSRGMGDIAEVPVSTYTTTVQDSYSSAFNDVAIITFSRYGGEMQDLVAKADGDTSEASMRRDANGDPIDLDGVQMLSLHQQELDVLNMVKNSNKFDKIVVILNSAYPMDTQEIAELADSILWIGNPGTYGFEGVVNLLTGQADPSGRTVDTFATSSISAPAMRNYGDFQFSNLNTTYKEKYLIYAEGIYIGYKYYETRYYDEVLGLHNAESTKGTYASSGSWNYGDEMMYTFGTGNSYVDFTQTVNSIVWDKTTHEITANVTVTNNGAPEGSNFDDQNTGSKSVVQLYAQLPYTEGGTEKSAIQLVGFSKTNALKAGESQTIDVNVSDYMFATYDMDAVNGADSSLKGGYVFDSGDYYFAIGDNAHDALNNIMAKQGHNGLYNEEGISVTGDANKAVLDTLATYDNTTYARSETGEIVSNQLEDIDINYFLDEADKITYLTRSDWNTYPEAITDLTATSEIASLMDGHLYTKPADAPNISSFSYGTTDTPITIKFIEMLDIAWDDDATWETYLNQFTVKDLYTIPGEKMANDAIPAIGIPANKSGDGPGGLQTYGVQHASEVTAASTYNIDLLYERGAMLGEEAMTTNQHGVYGPGMNFHRTPYNGRNQEYYSEDAIIAYMLGSAQVAGSRSKGLITFIKHFVGNDQEINRHGVATMSDEQTYRQNYLKAFEGGFVVGESLGTMTSYNRIGLTPSGAHYTVMTQILRNEWGFKGINLTDSSKDATSYMYTAESIAGGTNQFNNDAGRSDDVKTLLINDKDGYIWSLTRQNIKYYTYAYLHSFLINGLSPETEVEAFVPWWQKGIYALDASVGVLTAAMFTWTAISFYKTPRDKKLKKEMI